MKKIAILVEDHYQVLEVWYPYLRFKEDGIKLIENESNLIVDTRGKFTPSKKIFPA